MDNCVIKSSHLNLTLGKLWGLVKLAKNWSTFAQDNRLPFPINPPAPVEDRNEFFAATGIMSAKAATALSMPLFPAFRDAESYYYATLAHAAHHPSIHPASTVILAANNEATKAMPKKN